MDNSGLSHQIVLGGDPVQAFKRRTTRTVCYGSFCVVGSKDSNEGELLGSMDGSSLGRMEGCHDRVSVAFVSRDKNR